MSTGASPGRGRTIAVTAGACLASSAALVVLLAVARQAWQAIAAPGPADPSDGLLLVVGLVGAALVLWLALSVALSILGQLPGRAGRACSRLAERLAPAFARRLVALALGSSLTAVALPAASVSAASDAGPARPTVASALVGASGAPDGSPEARRAAAVSSAVPDPALRPTPLAEPRPELAVTSHSAADAQQARSDGMQADGDVPGPSWTPTRPAVPARATSGGLGVLHAHGRPAIEEHVVVRRGDTLWDLTARYLGPEASAAEIAAEWPRWYAANRSTIGADPDLLLPGQRLVPPDAQKATR